MAAARVDLTADHSIGLAMCDSTVRVSGFRRRDAYGGHDYRQTPRVLQQRSHDNEPHACSLLMCSIRLTYSTPHLAAMNAPMTWSIERLALGMQLSRRAWD